MIATALALPQDCSLPDWLSSCLIEQQTEADPLKAAMVPAAADDAALTAKLPVNDNQLVCRAFEFAYQLHKGQKRASGEPYIAHPVAVAGLLRSLGETAP